MRLALLLLVSSCHYKALLTKENLLSVCQYPSKFSRQVLPRLKFASWNFNPKVYKVYKILDDVLRETKGVQEQRATRVGLREGLAPGAKQEKK